MAGKADTFTNDYLKLIFNAVAIANIADNAASAPLTNLYVSLHTDDPTDAGDQTSNEIAYTGYARVAVARIAGAWAVSASVVSPVSFIVFQEMTGGAGGTVTHWGVGTDTSGTGKLLYSGLVVPNPIVVLGFIPRLTAASTVTED